MALAMSLADMRTFVRSHLDVDADELPDSLLDRFLYEGANRIERAAVVLGGRWSFREVEYDLQVLSGTQTYALDGHADLISPAPLSYVEEVRGPNWTLSPEDHRALRLRYRASVTNSGTPRYWSQWGRTLYLWPKPSANATFYVLGERKATDWIATNDTPDFPAEMHELLAWWALGRAYAQQDDFDSAAYYREDFKEALRDRARPYLLGNDNPVLQLNRSETPIVTRNESGLGYSWEQ